MATSRKEKAAEAYARSKGAANLTDWFRKTSNGSPECRPMTEGEQAAALGVSRPTVRTWKILRGLTRETRVVQRRR